VPCNGTLGNSGNCGSATSAQVSHPYGLAFDKAGNLYVADIVYGLVRRVTPGGIIVILVGFAEWPAVEWRAPL